MTAAAQDIESMGEFFAPASTDMVDGLVGRYKELRERIEHMSGLIIEDAGAVSYFLNGNGGDSRYSMPSVTNLFDVTGAIAELNSDFWKQAMNLTDVYDCMPQKRRDEWYESIKNNQCPDFEEETVRATLGSLLASRSKFFAERVDGIFRALSGEHVTNRPEGFSKRMILANVLDTWGFVNHSKSGYINDLRAIMAKFMGREELKHNATDSVIKAAKRNPGEWMQIDGGAMKIRVYCGVGTAHIEIHPDMAYRLNSVLAMLHPSAIPAKFRQRPKQTKKLKEFALMDRLLSFEVLAALAGMEQERKPVGPEWNRHYEPLPNTLAFRYTAVDRDKHVTAEAEKVLQAIGGVKVMKKLDGYWQFDYKPTEVLDEIICSGRIPDHKSHQFYPTPENVARAAVDMADIGDDDICLEPSAGQGGIADLMPKDRTTCIEVSSLHCEILRAKGFTNVVESDFLKVPTAPTFNCVVMNPPYSQGRWQAHTEAAAKLVKAGGRLVVILPASAREKFHIDGFAITWSDVFSNEFVGTSTSVVIMKAIRI